MSFSRGRYLTLTRKWCVTETTVELESEWSEVLTLVTYRQHIFGGSDTITMSSGFSFVLKLASDWGDDGFRVPPWSCTSVVHVHIFQFKGHKPPRKDSVLSLSYLTVGTDQGRYEWGTTLLTSPEGRSENEVGGTGLGQTVRLREVQGGDWYWEVPV